MSLENRKLHAALTCLIILQVIMLLSLYAQSPPHPPLSIPLFALGPFLAASISLATAAIVLGPVNNRTGKIITLCAAATAMLSFGPQKWFDTAFPQIWPAVILAQLCALTIVIELWRANRAGQTTR